MASHLLSGKQEESYYRHSYGMWNTSIIMAVSVVAIFLWMLPPLLHLHHSLSLSPNCAAGEMCMCAELTELFSLLIKTWCWPGWQMVRNWLFSQRVCGLLLFLQPELSDVSDQEEQRREPCNTCTRWWTLKSDCRHPKRLLSIAAGVAEPGNCTTHRLNFVFYHGELQPQQGQQQSGLQGVSPSETSTMQTFIEFCSRQTNQIVKV